MVTMICKCGKSKFLFNKLTEADFGSEGWVAFCCEKEEDAELIDIKLDEAPKVDVVETKKKKIKKKKESHE